MSAQKYYEVTIEQRTNWTIVVQGESPERIREIWREQDGLIALMFVGGSNKIEITKIEEHKE